VVGERWETRDDLNAHGRAPHMKVWREYSSQMKASPTVIEIISADKVDTIKA
jgi:quinol monooxygenase YgiN